ncbi:MAG: hypothetical protein RLY31_820 [Bacteroidota bacterium]
MPSFRIPETFASVFQDPVIRILLIPFAMLYGLGVSLRNFLYRHKLLSSVRFSVPVISVGNLSIGGAGKTPHIEYLIRLLRPYLTVATLSRGYRRETRGYQVVLPSDHARKAGDEPLQFKRKFPDVFVTVCESRALGIPALLQDQPDTQVVLLDDAFQHLSVRPGLNILLTEYDRPFTRDFLLPSGRLREWRSAYRRADLVIVSKCPADLTETEADKLRDTIRPFGHQRVLFSAYRYDHPYYILNPQHRIPLQEDMAVLLVCAIANTDYLQRYLQAGAGLVRTLAYEDHHYFTAEDLHQIERNFLLLPATNRIILTTEKDAVRLELHRDWLLSQRIPVMVLPASVHFLFDGAERFDAAVKSYLLNFKV